MTRAGKSGNVGKEFEEELDVEVEKEEEIGLALEEAVIVVECGLKRVS